MADQVKDFFKKIYQMKIYLVFQRNNVAREGEANVRVVACKLNFQSAKAVVEELPGTYIQKIYGNKVPAVTPLLDPGTEEEE